jgi:hypothetical protein
MDSGDVVLTPKRSSLIWPSVGSLILLLLAIWFRGDNPPMAWLGIFVFGLALVVFSVSLLPGSAFLRITTDGFQDRSLFRDRFYKWEDIAAFVPYKPSPRARLWRVGFRYRVGYVPPKGRAGRLGVAAARSLTGVEGGVSSNFGRSAQDLADLLNARLEQSRGLGHA